MLFGVVVSELHLGLIPGVDYRFVGNYCITQEKKRYKPDYFIGQKYKQVLKMQFLRYKHVNGSVLIGKCLPEH